MNENAFARADLVLICPGAENDSSRFSRLPADWEGGFKRIIRTAEDLRDLEGSRLMLAISLNAWGVNLEWCRMLEVIRRVPGLMENCVGAVLVEAPSELYTKAVGREAVLAANLAGCWFPGRPLVEGTGSLYNFHTQARLAGCGLEEAFREAVRDLLERLASFAPPKHRAPRLLVLHASIRETSNTFRLWSMVREHLEGRVESLEISLQNGAVHDCVGCPFTTCMHFARQKSCFYGGVVVEQVYPALEECQGVLFLCPNYNDALSANISASINRLTSLYRVHPFFDKSLYGIVVSGYSGGELVASQLVSSMNMNKAFLLPPRFAMLETANDPGSILQAGGIEERAAAFAEQIVSQMTEQMPE